MNPLGKYLSSCMSWKWWNRPTISSSLRNLLFGVTGVSVIVIVKSEFDRTASQNEVQLRKSRLAMPPYVLTGDELTNPPWAKGNLEDWLYRPVVVRGRAVHRKEMRIPVVRGGAFKGSASFVPLVTKEDEESTYESREGLILGVGWIPTQFEHPANRHYWPDSWKAHSYVGYVTTNPELYRAGNGSNIDNEQHFDIRYYYLPEMAKATGFKNQAACRVAAIERVNLDTPNDERDPRHYDVPLDSHTGYPYIKTRAGALQGKMMPWDYRNRQWNWALAGTLSGALALVCKLA